MVVRSGADSRALDTAGTRSEDFEDQNPPFCWGFQPIACDMFSCLMVFDGFGAFQLLITEYDYVFLCSEVGLGSNLLTPQHCVKSNGVKLYDR